MFSFCCFFFLGNNFSQNSFFIMRFFFSCSVLLLIAFSFAKCEDPATEIVCDKELRVWGSAGGLYQTDGVPGIQAYTYVKLQTENRSYVHVCEMGVRFPHPDRVSHCLPPPDNAICPPGEALNIPFDLPFHHPVYPIESMGFEVNVQGHPNGNYAEYRHLWDDCQNNDLDCDKLPLSWSWVTQHVDAHFFFMPADEARAIFWEGFPVNPPPSDIQANCDNIPPIEGFPTAYYNEQDCVIRMGRHWVEDKLETLEVFQRQPALIYGSYAGEVNFWEVMVAGPIFDWVRDFAPYQTTTISYPQPRGGYPKAGMYPTHYIMKEVTEEDQLVAKGRTVQIGVTNFVYRDNLYRVDDDGSSGGAKLNASWLGSLGAFFVVRFLLWN